MKQIMTAFVLALCSLMASAHDGIELGPNKGRILELSTDESMHGEVTEKDGKLHIALLDKDMKPCKVEAQSLTALAGSREAPVKLEVTKSADGFLISTPKQGEWIIMQYKETADAKPIVARLNYNLTICAPCGNPEWRCGCVGQH